MTAEWIARNWRDNPCMKLDNGNVRMGPCRAAFVNVLEQRKKDGVEKGYGVVLLVPDLAIIGADALQTLQDEYMAWMKEKAPAALTNPDLAAKYHNPFKKQGSWIDKKTGQLYEGFVPGRIAISANSSKSKPPVVDINGAPIVEKSRIYSGCWVIPAVKAQWINNTENEGPTFYLQSLMVIADDENLGGDGGSDPSKDFAGVKVDATVNPAAAFGMGATAGGVVDEAAAQAAARQALLG